MVCDRQNHRQHGFNVTNLYGPVDNFHPTNSHVLSALIRRFHEAAQVYAPSVACAATGTPFSELLNVGTGVDLTTFEPTASEAKSSGMPASLISLRRNSWM